MFYRRKDAKLIKGLPPINTMMPYLLRDRIGSQVYLPVKLYMDNAIEYVKRKGQEEGRRRLSYFDIVIAALMRSIAMKPEMNRFVKGRHFYQRNKLSASFIVKRRLTEEDEERQAIVLFDPADTLDDCSRRIRQAIEDMRHMDVDGEEKVMRVLLKLPDWFVNFFTHTLMRWDNKGIMPTALSEVDAMHTSIYIANLGSVGFDEAPFHHLYEWGTTSHFLTLGRLHKERVFSKDGTESVRYVINASVTIDERISEGLYYGNAVKLFRKLVENPERLEQKPDLPDIWERIKQPGKILWVGGDRQ